jgi:integrase
MGVDMSPKDRLKKNKKLPSRWRWDKNGSAIYYRVPPDQVHLWRAKEKRLGATLTEAHQFFAKKIAEFESAHSVDMEYPTMAALIDHYEMTVTAKKSPGTQHTERQMLGKWREIIGHIAPGMVTAQALNKIKHKTIERIKAESGGKRSGVATANHRNRILSHVFTMGLEWGAIDVHPMINKQVTRVTRPARDRHEPTDTQFAHALKFAPDWMQAYCEIKIRIGIRQTDMLLIRLSQVQDDCLVVPLSKVRNTTRKVLEFELTPDLRYWIDKARVANRQPGIASIWLFHTRHGNPYINLDNYKAESFSSAWGRWQDKWQAAGGQKFEERILRNKVANDVTDVIDAMEILGHESVSTTNIYRTRPVRVVPVKRST